MRRGLCDLLQSHAGWEVCAEAADGREALDNAQQLKPDIVILDIGMPNLNDLTAARQMLRNDTYQKILFLTIADSEQTPSREPRLPAVSVSNENSRARLLTKNW